MSGTTLQGARYFPSTDQKAVPNQTRNAKSTSEKPFPKTPMAGPSSNRKKGATFGEALISTPMRTKSGMIPQAFTSLANITVSGIVAPVTTLTRSCTSMEMGILGWQF